MTKDKKLHFIVCAIISFVFGASAITTWGAWAILSGFAVGMLAGVAKELYDSRKGGTGWDWADIKYDLYGSLVGSAAVSIIVLIAVSIIALIAFVGKGGTP